MTTPVFDGLFDDAAVFPPALAALPKAVSDHLERRATPAGRMMGPLVIPAGSLAEADRLVAAAQPDARLGVSVVGDAASVRSALAAAPELPHVTICAVELKPGPDVATDVAELALPADAELYVELALAEVRAGALTRLGPGARAKFRTGGLSADLYPAPEELAELIEAAVDAGVSFKLTAGLHRAIRYTNASTGITHHGFLNVAVAIQAARGTDGPRRREAVRAMLTTRDPEMLREAVENPDWREVFVSFGTCSIPEPLASLEADGFTAAGAAARTQEVTGPVKNQESAAATYATEGFGIENLPYGSYVVPGQEPRLGVRLGSQVLDAGRLARLGRADALLPLLDAPNLDALLAAGHEAWAEVRTFLREFLTSDASRDLGRNMVHTIEEVTMVLPFTVGDYVDFYASENHATNVGRIFRPDQAPLLPNWHHLPIGYHGRSSTIVVSGTDVVRPKGLRPTGPGQAPSFGPSQRLDIEAEIGYVVGGKAPDGEVALEDADRFIFGLVVVNDWSARDIQAFEYVPLGPFLGKSFATSISPWVVPLGALDAARVAPPARVTPLAGYLDDAETASWAFDLTLAIEVDGRVLSHPPYRTMYYTGAQMLSHLTVNGASVRPGDFFASGTVSGPEADQRGSLLELSWGGKEPINLGADRTMTFLEDAQQVSISATAPGPDGSTIDFGAVTGRVLPARIR